MRPIEAWLKLCKSMKKNELYDLKTFTILGHPALSFFAKMDDAENLIFYGNPKMGGLKLTEPIIMGSKEFMALYPLYFSKDLFAPQHSDIIPDAPFIFPLIEQFLIRKQESHEVSEVIEEKSNANDDDDNNNASGMEDAHLRAKNRKVNK